MGLLRLPFKLLSLMTLVSVVIVSGKVEFADNGYSNVVISVDPDIGQDRSDDIIAGIESWIQEGSQVRKRDDRITFGINAQL